MMLARIIRRVLHGPFRLTERFLRRLPAFAFIKETAETQTPISLGMWFRQELLGVNHGPYWPVHPSSMVTNWKNVLAGVETSPGQMPNCYIQAIGPIIIGDYTQIGPGVGLISSDHDKADLRRHEVGRIEIGRYCWIGHNATVLPNVILGDFTIVGAGAVVTKSYPNGFQVLAGNPARVIGQIDKGACIEHRSAHEYHGFIRKTDFPAYRDKVLTV